MTAPRALAARRPHGSNNLSTDVSTCQLISCPMSERYIIQVKLYTLQIRMCLLFLFLSPPNPVKMLPSRQHLGGRFLVLSEQQLHHPLEAPRGSQMVPFVALSLYWARQKSVFQLSKWLRVNVFLHMLIGCLRRLLRKCLCQPKIVTLHVWIQWNASQPADHLQSRAPPLCFPGFCFCFQLCTALTTALLICLACSKVKIELSIS